MDVTRSAPEAQSIYELAPTGGLWPAKHVIWGQEADGSNPSTPTIPLKPAVVLRPRIHMGPLRAYHYEKNAHVPSEFL